jgi:hypothetical protein
MSDVTERPPLFADYLTEAELAAEAGKSLRTLRDERQRRIGPPFVKWGNLILYSRDGFREYLKSREQAPRLRNRAEHRATRHAELTT